MREAKLAFEQFAERFVAEMLRIVGPVFSNGDSIEQYARDVARSYFDQQYADDEECSPEELAESDVSYWEY